MAHGSQLKKMRYLSIDYGEKRTGLAICDADETIASPLKVLHGKAVLTERIIEIIKAEQIEAVVVGLPLNMDDSEGSQARLTREFAKQLQSLIDVPIHFQDERLSSFEAGEKLVAAEFTTKKRKKYLDAVAAAEILMSFLHKKHSA